MKLPLLSIPEIPLPFEIPSMIHPVFVHFAIALPVVILLLELINIFVKKRTIGVLSFFFMLIIAAIFVAAYLTGVTDGKAAKEFLSPEAKTLLGEHKQLAIYLVYASGVLLLFKLFSVIIRKTVIRVLFFLVLIAFTAAVFNEGKKGGSLVYEYGVNVASVPAISKKVKDTGAPGTSEKEQKNSKDQNDQNQSKSNEAAPASGTAPQENNDTTMGEGNLSN